MRHLLALAALLALLPAVKAETAIFRAKMKIAKATHAILNADGLLFLPATITQKAKGILIQAEQPSWLQYHLASARLLNDQGCTSIYNVRGMKFTFNVTRPGTYRAWYRGSYPTTFAYNHRERMDDEESIGFIQDSDRQPPNVWRWHSGPTYNLDKGTHVWDFPSPTAWCGGTKLDKMVLMPPDAPAVTDQNANWDTDVDIPQNGEILIRRIRTRYIQQWMIKADTQLNGGSFDAEYRYDQQPFQQINLNRWNTPPASSRHLYLRFRLTSAPKAKVSPFVYNLELTVQEK